MNKFKAHLKVHLILSNAVFALVKLFGLEAKVEHTLNSSEYEIWTITYEDIDVYTKFLHEMEKTYPSGWDTVTKEAIEYMNKCLSYNKNVGISMTNLIRYSFPEIKKIIFNPPATVVLWADNTKTVVKCRECDEFNPETGLAMAIMRKVYGRSKFVKMVDLAEYEYLRRHEELKTADEPENNWEETFARKLVNVFGAKCDE